ncbi:hypothetical protein D9613_003747 [Agrocybe pediades]|uniref:Uncharacterized protein n=1 Tax=Agrocybe pediades TaxID=84607 RepID=A0A8H4QJP9_9AGAR|nr:hypothetical protein D9613_003747 [Agrocybe pediades]
MPVENLSLVERSRSLYTKTYATVLSALAYGIVLMLSANCYRAISAMAKRNGSSPRCLKTRILRVYTTFMLLASTLAVIQTVYSFIMKLRRSTGFDYESSFFSHGFTSPLALPFAIWGADGFMTWRCLILYSGISRKRYILLRMFLGFLGLLTFTSGLLLLITSITYQVGTLFLIPFFILENITLTGLIIARIIRHQAAIEPLLGQGNRPTYSWIMGMCVESCILIVTFPSAWLIYIFTDGYMAQIVASNLPHICVIAALMLVSRVANGIEIKYEESLKESQLERVVEEGLSRLGLSDSTSNPASFPTSTTGSVVLPAVLENGVQQPHSGSCLDEDGFRRHEVSVEPGLTSPPSRDLPV